MDVRNVGGGRENDTVATLRMDAFALPVVEVVHDAPDVARPFPDGSFRRDVSHPQIEPFPSGRQGREPLFENSDEAARVLSPRRTFAFDPPHADPRHAGGEILTPRRCFARPALDNRRAFDPNSHYPRKRRARASVQRERADGVDYHRKAPPPSLDGPRPRRRRGIPPLIDLVLRRA